MLSPCGAGLESGVQQAAELAALPGWWALPAVRTGRVFVADHSLFSRPGPRSALLPHCFIAAFTGRCIMMMWFSSMSASVCSCSSCRRSACTVLLRCGDAAVLARFVCRLVDGVEAMARMLHPDLVSRRIPDGIVRKLSLSGGQRCRQSALPGLFLAYA